MAPAMSRRAGVKWSILILTQPSRSTTLWPLVHSLRRQLVPGVAVTVGNDDKLIGLGASRQRMMGAADGEYVSWVDDDDEVPPNFIATILPCLSRVDYVGFKSERWVDGRLTGVGRLPRCEYGAPLGELLKSLFERHLQSPSWVGRHQHLLLAAPAACPAATIDGLLTGRLQAGGAYRFGLLTLHCGLVLAEVGDLAQAAALIQSFIKREEGITPPLSEPFDLAKVYVPISCHNPPHAGLTSR